MTERQLTLLQQIPLKVEIKPLIDQWSYFYERCIGCIGVLKDWLVRTKALYGSGKGQPGQMETSQPVPYVEHVRHLLELEEPSL